jgi:DNA-binding NarL/FixJ family response regulator
VVEHASLLSALSGLADAGERVPELAVVDLDLGDGNGVDFIRAFKRRFADRMAIVSTMFDDDAHLFGAIAAGAEGYLLKDESQSGLVHMLTEIRDGKPPLSASIARRLLRHFATKDTSSNSPASPDGLTAREIDVLTLTGKGLSVPKVAELLELSRHTVAGYVKDIYRKLGISSRAEAALEASRRGLAI